MELCSGGELLGGGRLVMVMDDGKILTGNPDQFDGKNPWVSWLRFSLKPIH